MTIFNRRRVRLHRDRAASHLGEFDFLFEETAGRLADRLLDITRTFPLALDLGCHGGALARVIGDQGRVETLFQADLSPAMAGLALADTGFPAFAADEEFLPLANERLDAVFSNLSLHWVNDLPGALGQVRRALKPDGLFLAAVVGGESLKELRTCLTDAEIEISNGLSPRVSPFAGVRDLGSLLQRAGLALPVVDTDTITVGYASPLKLMRDLRGMGESNAAAECRKGLTPPGLLFRAAELYQQRFADEDGRVPATFQILYMTAWAPAETQRKPLKPGSASRRLADVLDTEEVSLGEKARPREKW